MQANDIGPSPRTITYPALTGAAEAIQAGVGAVFDDDAIKLSVATATTAQVYSGAGLDGVIGASAMSPRRGFTVVTAAAAACYNTTDPIVITGTVTLPDGKTKTVTARVTLTQAGGNETLDFDVGMDQVTSIAVPAQLDITGHIKIGVGDIYSKFGNSADGIVERNVFRVLLGMGSGNFKVGYAGGFRDVFASADGRIHLANAIKIFRSGTTVTAFQIQE